MICIRAEILEVVIYVLEGPKGALCMAIRVLEDVENVL